MRTGRSLVPISSALVLAGTMFLGVPHATGRTGLTWNMSTDFRVSPDEANPNPDSYGNPDVWWFMQGTTLHDPSTYLLLPGGFDDAVCDFPGLEGWVGQYVQPPPGVNLPFVGINATGAPSKACSSNFVWPPGAIFTHPAPDQFSVIGWQSPVRSSVFVKLRIVDVDATGGNGILWSFDEGSTVIASAVIHNGGSKTVTVRVRVQAGEFLYSIVDANQGDIGFDTTRVGWVINTTS